jgi:hypothetical protein
MDDQAYLVFGSTADSALNYELAFNVIVRTLEEC